MARAQGISRNTIHRIWQEHQPKPHLTKSFKLSRDPEFLEKLTDVDWNRFTRLHQAKAS